MNFSAMRSFIEKQPFSGLNRHKVLYMQARYYDPVIGRFYSNAPVGWTPANPVMSFNRYLYVNNKQYKYTDPNGEFLATILGGAAIGAVVSGGIEAYKQIKSGKGLGLNSIASEAGKGALIGAAAGAGVGLMQAMRTGVEVSKAVMITGDSAGAGAGVVIAEGTNIIVNAVSNDDYSLSDLNSDMSDANANIIGAAAGPLAQGAASMATRSTLT